MGSKGRGVEGGGGPWELAFKSASEWLPLYPTTCVLLIDLRFAEGATEPSASLRYEIETDVTRTTAKRGDCGRRFELVTCVLHFDQNGAEGGAERGTGALEDPEPKRRKS